MSENPAGWHPDPLDGRRLRYWDGAEWTEQTAAIQVAPSTADQAVAVDDANPRENHKTADRTVPHRRPRWLLWSGAACLLAVALVGLALFNSGLAPFSDVTSGPSPSPSASAPASAPGKLSPDASEEEVEAYIESLGTLPDAPKTDANATMDASLESQGWTPVVSGNVYIYLPTPDEYTCGYLDCLYMSVYTVKGCPGGVFVEGSIMTGDISIGRVNDWTAALAPEQQAEILFEDYTRRGDGFKVNGATCR